MSSPRPHPTYSLTRAKLSKMGRGRKPIPDQLKVLRGTNQKCRMKGDLEAEKINEISQIVDLKNFKVLKSKRAKDIFVQKANQLIKLKLLTDMDIEQLVVYASSMDILFDCIREMKKEMFIKTYEIVDEIAYLKSTIPNPHIKLYREMIEITVRIGSDFGFSPVSRMKLKAEKEQEKDPLQKLFEQFNS